MNTLSIGQKIKKFRIQKGLSQQELEMEIDAASGSISRIEAGKVNPTKETLVDISNYLKLNAAEKAYLMNITNIFVSEEEIQKAVESVNAYFDRPDVFAYLLDDRYRFIHASEGFRLLFHINSRAEFVKANRGKFIMQIAMDRTLPIFQFLEKDSYLKLLEFQFSRMMEDLKPYEEEPWYTEITAPLAQFPEFNEIKSQISPLPEDNLPPESRTVVFNVQGRKLSTLYTREKLIDNPRFTVVDYLLVPEKNQLFELIKA